MTVGRHLGGHAMPISSTMRFNEALGVGNLRPDPRTLVVKNGVKSSPLTSAGIPDAVTERNLTGIVH